MENSSIVTVEKVEAHCTGCGQEVKAVAIDGIVKGYCAVSKKVVEALIIH